MPFFWVFLAAAGAVTKDIISKKTSVSISGLLSAFASFFFPLPLYVLLLAALHFLGLEDFHIGEGFFLAVFLRASTDTIAETSKMYALASIEFSTFASITSLNSVVVLLISPLITGDPLTGGVVAGSIISVIGAVLTTFQRSNPPAMKGLLLSIASLFSFSLMSCIDRITVRAASGPLSAFAMTLAAAVFLLPMAVRSRESLVSIGKCAKPFTVRAMFEVTNMSAKLIAAQYFTAPEVTTLMRMNLVIAVIAGQKLFNEEGFLRRLAGVLLVILGAGIILYSRLSS